MDLTHLHLLTNHIPILGTILIFILLVYSIIRKKNKLFKLSLVFVFIAGIILIPVYLTGEPAEESLEKIPGMTEGTAEQHEEAAQISLVIISSMSVISLAGILIFKKTMIPAWFKSIILIFCFASVISIAYTANTGGVIRHTELRNDK